jgi:hypothetical protein
MIAFDADEFAAASAHAARAAAIFTTLHDPWGELESGLLIAQVALARGDAGAGTLVADCDLVALDEAEPRQHRHLTRAWLAQSGGDWGKAADEIERARTAYRDWGQVGDHTPALLKRLAKLQWEGASRGKIGSWLQGVERSEADLSRFLVDAPSSPSSTTAVAASPSSPEEP